MKAKLLLSVAAIGFAAISPASAETVIIPSFQAHWTARTRPPATAAPAGPPARSRIALPIPPTRRLRPAAPAAAAATTAARAAQRAHPRPRQRPTPRETPRASSIATGGAGGSGSLFTATGVGGNGGAATASAVTTAPGASGTVSATSTATGGVGGGAPFSGADKRGKRRRRNRRSFGDGRQRSGQCVGQRNRRRRRFNERRGRLGPAIERRNRSSCFRPILDWPSRCSRIGDGRKRRQRG